MNWSVRVQSERERLLAAAKESTANARLLGPLTKESAYGDWKKLSRTVLQMKPKVQGGNQPLLNMLTELEGWLREAPETQRREVGRLLKQMCEERGLSFGVTSRDDPVKLRIAPFAVEIDFQAGKASLQFAQKIISAARVDAADILAKREEIMKHWDTGFDPGQFHERCRRAWRAAKAAEEQVEDRVEILKFLPHLALQMQSEKFAIEPESKSFQGYGRARFAYDIMKLRRDRKLDHGGWRLNLGVATGGSGQDNKRAVYFEDEHGVGEKKINVFFQRSEASA